MAGGGGSERGRVEGGRVERGRVERGRKVERGREVERGGMEGRVEDGGEEEEGRMMEAKAGKTSTWRSLISSDTTLPGSTLLKHTTIFFTCCSMKVGLVPDTQVSLAR